MALLRSWQHRAWLSITAGSSQPPVSKVSKHTAHSPQTLPIYWVLKDNRSVYSQLMKSSLNLSFCYHDLHKVKPNQAVQVKAWIKWIASYGLHFPYSAALWKAKKLCIMQILARTFDTTCSEFFHLLFPPLLSKEDSSTRACSSSSAQIGQRHVFRQRNL